MKEFLIMLNQSLMNIFNMIGMYIVIGICIRFGWGLGSWLIGLFKKDKKK